MIVSIKLITKILRHPVVVRIIEWQFNFSLPRTSLSTPTGDNKVRNFVDKLDKLVHLEIDINKESHKQEMTRMQQMLEETLVKNMHLQDRVATKNL